MAKRSKRKKGRGGDASPPPARAAPSRFSTVGLPLFLATVAFLVYGPSLHSDFVYDARKEVLEEGFITSLYNLPAVLSLKVLGMPLFLGARPGQLLYLMAIAAVCGKAPFGYHLCSALLHAANVALLFVLLRRLLTAEAPGLGGSDFAKAELAAAVAALIFAVHPLAAETVAEVSYSSDLLVAFFTLAALLAATAFQPANLRVAWMTGGVGTLCAFSAVACKESGLAVALLLVIYWLLFRRREALGAWLYFLAAAAGVTAAFLIARFSLAPASTVQLNYLGGTISGVFLNQPRLWVFMMGKLFWPVGLSADYTLENADGLSTPLALLILAVAVALQAWLAVNSRLGALGVATYWLGLVTVSNLVPLNRILGDRFYYVPLAGVAMQLLALFLMTLRPRGRFWFAIVPCVVAAPILALLTFKREAVFADDFSLWSDTVQVSPFSFTAHNDLGHALFVKGQPDDAIGHYLEALKINPDDAAAHNNLGNAFLQKGQVDEAMAQFEAALKIEPDFAEPHNNLGNALLRKGQVDDAIAQFNAALEIEPLDAQAHYNLGSVLLQRGKWEEAAARFNQALAIDPDYAEAHNNLGNALLQQGQSDAAITQYREALAINPTFADPLSNLGNALLQSGQVADAIAELRKAVAIHPADVAARDNLGAALFQGGQLDEAMAQFQEVLRLKPDDATARSNLAKAQASRK